MRIHLRTCEEYIEKYGPLQEFGDTVARYACPFCQCELHEDDLMDYCLTYHRTERRAVAINKVEEALIENVLDQSFLEYVHANLPNST